MKNKKYLKFLEEYKCKACSGNGHMKNNPDYCWACNGFKFDTERILRELKEKKFNPDNYDSPESALKKLFSDFRKINHSFLNSKK